MRTGVRDFGRGLEEVVTSGLATRFDERAFGDHLNRLEARASHARSRLTGALGMALSLAAPVKLAADFDQSFKGLEKVVDAPLKRLQELRKFALDTSAIVPVAAKDIIELMAEAAQGGVPVNELEAFSLYVANAAVAFDMAGAEIGERFARLRNVYRLNREGLETLGDATNHLSNNMAAKAAEITNFTNRAAGAAKIFNLTAIETGSVGAAMIAAGIIPETAARGFNAMATRVEANAKGVEDAFEALGTSREQFLGDLDTDGAAAIRNLFAAMAESKKGMEALIALVGQDFADDFAKFLGNPELLKQAFELTGDAAAYAGSAVEEARKQASGATRQFDLLKNRLTHTAILIGTVLLPPLLKLAETVGGVTDQFAAWAQANPEPASVLVQSAAAMLAFGIASRVAGFLWAAFGLRLFRFLGLFMRFGRAGRNVALLAGPLRMLAGAGRIFGRLARSAGWFLASIAPGRIKGALAGLHMLATFGKGTALATLFTGLRTAAVAALSAIAAAGWPVVLTIVLIAAAVFLLWKYWERFKAFMKGFGDGLYDAFAPDIEWISGKWESLVSDVRGWVGEIAEITGADAEAAMAAFDRLFDFSSVDAQLARVRDAVVNFFSDLFTQEQLGDAEKGEVEAAGRRIGKGLGNAIRSAIANLVTLGALIVEHIIAGLEAAWSDLTDWFSTRFDALGELISFDIDWPEPPSWMKWLAEKAGFVDEPKQSAPSETPAPEPAAPKSDRSGPTEPNPRWKAGFVDEPEQPAPSETTAPEPVAPKSDGSGLTEPNPRWFDRVTQAVQSVSLSAAGRELGTALTAFRERAALPTPRPIGEEKAVREIGEAFTDFVSDADRVGDALEAGAERAGNKLRSSASDAGNELGNTAEQKLRASATTVGTAIGRAAAAQIRKASVDVRVSASAGRGGGNKAAALHDGVDE